MLIFIRANGFKNVHRIDLNDVRLRPRLFYYNEQKNVIQFTTICRLYFEEITNVFHERKITENVKNKSNSRARRVT